MVIVVTGKHQKQLFYSNKTPFFRTLDLATLLLFGEMLVLTSYSRQLQYVGHPIKNETFSKVQ